MSHLMTKPTKLHVRPAKTQISLGIRPVWSESSPCAQWVSKEPNFLHADSEDSDQTGHMPFCWVCHEAAQIRFYFAWFVRAILCFVNVDTVFVRFENKIVILGGNARPRRQGLLYRRRGTEPARHAIPALPGGARYSYKLGWYGENMAPHVLQWTSSGTRGTPGSSDRGTAESKSKQRENDTGIHV